MSADGGKLARVVGEGDAKCNGHIWDPGVEFLGKLVVESEDIQADLGVAEKIAEKLIAAHSARVKVLVDEIADKWKSWAREHEIHRADSEIDESLSAYRGG